MYLPSHFQEHDTDALHRTLRDHPFAALVVHGPHGLDANHLPFEFDADAPPHGRLLAHVARANPVWQEVPNGSQVLVVFRACDAYVSPNWYPSKHEAHKQVPTWNYQVVHVHGTVRFTDDARFLRGIVGRLTRTHEARVASERPWKMSDAPADYLETMLQAIVGVEITIERIVGKSKLSQNKEARDRLGAIDGLEGEGARGVADAMRQAEARRTD